MDEDKSNEGPVSSWSKCQDQNENRHFPVASGDSYALTGPNYTGRLSGGQSVIVEAIPSDEPYAPPVGYRQVRQGPLDAADPDYERRRAQRQGE